MKRRKISIVIGSLCLALVIAVLPLVAACAKPAPAPAPPAPPPPAAEFEVSSLQVTPEEVLVRDSATIEANVSNIGNGSGMYRGDLKVNEEVVKTFEVSLAPGESDTMSFDLTKDEPGTYVIALDGLTCPLKVLKPAEFKVVNLDIAPNPVKVGEETTITVTIENVGEAEGTYKATVLLDGKVYHTSDVTLAGGARKLVSVVASKDSPGSYSIQIAGQEAILKVIEPVRLKTGTFLVLLKRKVSGGKARLKTENQLDLDAVVVLSLPEEPEIPVLALYVQSHDSYQVPWIRGGTYVLHLALGEDWDEDSRKFLSKATYHRFKGELKFVSEVYKYTIWSLTLDPAVIAVYAERVSEDEFPKLR